MDSLLCHVLKSTWDRAMRANELETVTQEDLKPRLGNLYKPCSMVPWRSIFYVFLSFIKKKVGWNSKNELLSWQNFETLIKFVAKWGTWSTCCNLNVLWGVWRHVEPTWKMESFLPSPMVAFFRTWYEWELTRWSLFRVRWWVAPVLRNQESLIVDECDTIIAWTSLLVAVWKVDFVKLDANTSDPWKLMSNLW